MEDDFPALVKDGILSGMNDGRFTGRTHGTLNMREGKVARLHDWLVERGAAPDASLASAFFYSDSINDLPDSSSRMVCIMFLESKSSSPRSCCCQRASLRLCRHAQ